MSDNPTSPVPSEIIAGLRAEAGAVEGVFGETVEALITGREKLSQLTIALREYADGLGQCREMDLPSVIHGLSKRIAETHLQITAEQRETQRMRQALADMRVPLSRLDRLIRTLEVFSSTASVIEAEVGLSDKSDFSGQIKALSARSLSGLRELQDLVITLRCQTDALQECQESYFTSSLGKLDGVADKLIELTGGVARGLRSESSKATSTQRLVERVTAAMSSTISALQVGDSFRQRLEHVVEAHQEPVLPDSAPPSCRDLLTIISAHQLTAAADALDRDLTALPRGLRDVSGGTAQLVDLAAEITSGSELAVHLEPLHSLTAQSLAVLYSGQTQRRAVERQLQAVNAIVTNMRDVLDRQGQVDEEMKLGSFNVSLRSREALRSAEAMSFVARQIAELIVESLHERREVVERLVEIADAVSDKYGDVAATTAADLDAICDELNVLSDVSTVWKNLNEGLLRLLDTGPKATAAFELCAVKMEAQRACVDRTRMLAADLSARAAGRDLPALVGDAEARAAAARMRQLYSVPEERDIHDTLCPPDLSGEKAPSQAQVDDEFEWF